MSLTSLLAFAVDLVTADKIEGSINLAKEKPGSLQHREPGFLSPYGHNNPILFRPDCLAPRRLDFFEGLNGGKIVFDSLSGTPLFDSGCLIIS